MNTAQKLSPCPFCGTPDRIREVQVPQQALYAHKNGIAVLTPAGFAALDRHHEMTDRIEELNAKILQLRSLALDCISDLKCENVHHRKGEYHEAHEECRAIARRLNEVRS